MIGSFVVMAYIKIGEVLNKRAQVNETHQLNFNIMFLIERCRRCLVSYADLLNSSFVLDIVKNNISANYLICYMLITTATVIIFIL